jgi:hypothetical protein
VARIALGGLRTLNIVMASLHTNVVTDRLFVLWPVYPAACVTCIVCCVYCVLRVLCVTCKVLRVLRSWLLE